MVAQSRLRVQFGNFCQIFNEVMLPKYSNLERVEMVQLLEDQTLANHLHFLKEHQTLAAEEVTDLVWGVVQQYGGRPFACQELFLQIFDKATEIHEQRHFREELIASEKFTCSSSKETKISTSERDLYLTRKIENLKEENEMLRSDIEEKAKTISETEAHLQDLQTQVQRYSDAFSRLENEKLELKGSVDKLKSFHVALVDDFAEKELLLQAQVEDLESELTKKKDECCELVKEHQATLADVNTLSCEIGERDLVISSLTSKLEEAVQVLEEKGEEEVCRTPLRSGYPAWRDSPDCSPVVLFKDQGGLCLEQELEQVLILNEKVKPFSAESILLSQAEDALEEEERRGVLQQQRANRIKCQVRL